MTEAKDPWTGTSRAGPDEGFTYTCEEHRFYTNIPFYAKEHMEKWHSK